MQSGITRLPFLLFASVRYNAPLIKQQQIDLFISLQNLHIDVQLLESEAKLNQLLQMRCAFQIASIKYIPPKETFFAKLISFFFFKWTKAEYSQPEIYT